MGEEWKKNFNVLDLHRQVVHVDIVNSTNPGITVGGVAIGGSLKQGPQSLWAPKNWF